MLTGLNPRYHTKYSLVRIKMSAGAVSESHAICRVGDIGYDGQSI